MWEKIGEQGLFNLVANHSFCLLAPHLSEILMLYYVPQSPQLINKLSIWVSFLFSYYIFISIFNMLHQNLCLQNKLSVHFQYFSDS